MRFKMVFKALFILAVLADIMDYFITQMGFESFSSGLETNQYVRLMMQWVNPYLASTIVFLVTLGLIIGAERLSKGYLNDIPYSGGLRDVGEYLWRGGTIKIRDLIIFASLILYVIFIHMHLSGFLSWLSILT